MLALPKKEGKAYEAEINIALYIYQHIKAVLKCI